MKHFTHIADLGVAGVASVLDEALAWKRKGPGAHLSGKLLGMVFFALNLTLRSRAIFNSMRAAYPRERFQWRRIWGAYWAAVGFNNVVPARGGDVIKVFLANCIACGCENELLIAMERAGLGDLAEALLPLVRR